MFTQKDVDHLLITVLLVGAFFGALLAGIAVYFIAR